MITFLLSALVILCTVAMMAAGLILQRPLTKSCGGRRGSHCCGCRRCPRRAARPDGVRNE